MTCQIENIWPQIAAFSQFQVYLNVIQAKQITSLLFLNNFYPVISYRRVEKKKKATNYCTRSGHSLRSAISCQRNGALKYAVRQQKGDRIEYSDTYPFFGYSFLVSAPCGSLLLSWTACTLKFSKSPRASLSRSCETIALWKASREREREEEFGVSRFSYIPSMMYIRILWRW